MCLARHVMSRHALPNRRWLQSQTTTHRKTPTTLQKMASLSPVEQVAELSRQLKRARTERKSPTRLYRNVKVTVAWDCAQLESDVTSTVAIGCLDVNCRHQQRKMRCPSADWCVGVQTVMDWFKHPVAFFPAPSAFVDTIESRVMPKPGESWQGVPYRGVHLLLQGKWFWEDVSRDFCRGFIDALALLELHDVGACVLDEGACYTSRKWRRKFAKRS